jgi:selenocysteine lyase/cysteine desulfurase
MCDFLGLLNPGCPIGGNGKGVVRISMVHYNSTQDVDELIRFLEEGIKSLSQSMFKPGKPMID